MRTHEVLAQLRKLGIHCTETRLNACMRSAKLTKPRKDPASNTYIWSPSDVEAARKALATDLRYKTCPPARKEVCA